MSENKTKATRASIKKFLTGVRKSVQYTKKISV